MEFFSNPAIKAIGSLLSIVTDVFVLIFLWNNRKELMKMSIFPKSNKN